MRKIIFTFVALIVLSVFFGSCSKEEITNNYYSYQQETSKSDEKIITDGYDWWTTLEYAGIETGEGGHSIGYNYKIIVFIYGDESATFDLWNPKVEGIWEIEQNDFKTQKNKNLTFNLSERNFKWFFNSNTEKYKYYGIYGEYTFFSKEYYNTDVIPKAKIKKGTVEKNSKIYILNTYPTTQFKLKGVPTP